MNRNLGSLPMVGGNSADLIESFELPISDRRFSVAAGDLALGCGTPCGAPAIDEIFGGDGKR